MSQPFDFERLVELCRRTHEETRHSAARAVDRSLVVRNWLFGWYILEFEGGGAARRALYGKELIDRLSARLRANRIKGCSPTNLRKCREFYEVFSDIQQTVSVESGEPSPGPFTPAPGANIYASKYQLYLPSRQELADQVARVRREIRGSAGGVDR